MAVAASVEVSREVVMEWLLLEMDPRHRAVSRVWRDAWDLAAQQVLGQLRGSPYLPLGDLVKRLDEEYSGWTATEKLLQIGGLFFGDSPERPVSLTARNIEARMEDLVRKNWDDWRRFFSVGGAQNIPEKAAEVIEICNWVYKQSEFRHPWGEYKVSVLAQGCYVVGATVLYGFSGILVWGQVDYLGSLPDGRKCFEKRKIRPFPEVHSQYFRSMSIFCAIINHIISRLGVVQMLEVGRRWVFG